PMSDTDRIADLESRIRVLEAALATRSLIAERLQHQAEAGLLSVNHRIRNLLASIRSIASHTAEHAGDLETFVENFDGRIGALARYHGMLSRSPDARIDLDEMLREEFLSHAVDHPRRISIDGPPVRLGPRTGEALALALHELAANALKFGALSDDGG